jgi:hypothetical protein
VVRVILFHVRTAAALAVLAAMVIGRPGIRTAPAKEHTASCPELGGMIGRVRASLEAAAGQRQRGSSMGAYQVLLATVDSMVRDSAGQHCGALGSTLAKAVRRASRSVTALDASIELDMGIDAALSLATEGHLPYSSSPPKVPMVFPTSATSSPAPVGEAALYARDCPDLFRLTMSLDGPQASLVGRVHGLLADLGAHPRCEKMRQVLSSAPADRLAHAVDSIRLDEPDETPLSSESDLLARCPELPLVVERLGAAIQIGAPQFNAGDAAACLETYRTAARNITAEVVGEERCPGVRSLLATGLARAESAPSPAEGAWAMRNSFDAILGGPAVPSP